MKNYKLIKLRVAKTGLVFGVNKFGTKWIELWWKGKFKVIKLENPLKPSEPTPFWYYLDKEVN